MNITKEEKIELLKDTIYQLFSKEGRSRVYISKLLKINRKTLGSKIKEWELPEPKPTKRVTPSVQKFINRNRQLIKSRLDHDIPISDIAKELQVSRDFIQRTVIPNDEILNVARNDYMKRYHQKAQEKIENSKNKSRLNYDITPIDGEVWKDILGYSDYQVSNMGRVRSYSKRYKSYYLITPSFNPKSGRMYISLSKSNKRKNFNLARLVGLAFVEGHSPQKNTINHKQGDVTDNRAEMLEWMSQSDNNRHAFRVLHKKPSKRRRKFNKIVYQNKYEFKTIRAFAKFIGISETQATRYLDEPEKHEIIIK